MLKKEYPKVTMMRKNIMIIVIVGMCLLVGLIFFNMYNSTHKTKKPPSLNTKISPITASDIDTEWYKNANIPKTEVSQSSITNDQQILAENKILQQELVQLKRQQEQGEQRAKIAPISANQININNDSKATSSFAANGGTDTADAKKATAAAAAAKTANSNDAIENDPDYLNEKLTKAKSICEIKAGTVIPGVLLTGITSEMNGQIIGQVRSNIYDTVSGKYLMIAQGAKIIGIYNNMHLNYGQERMFIVWKRIIMGDGSSIDLEDMPGADAVGFAGFNDQVNNHYGKLFSSALLLSIISAGAQLSQPQQQFNGNGQISVNQSLAASLGASVASTADAVTTRNINVQPTLAIRPGYLFNIIVNKDITLPNICGSVTNMN